MASQGRLVEGLRRQVSELEARLRESELAREAAEQRALLSEAREIAHQDRWAHEIHTLRGEVRQLTEEGIGGSSSSRGSSISRARSHSCGPALPNRTPRSRHPWPADEDPRYHRDRELTAAR